MISLESEGLGVYTDDPTLPDEGVVASRGAGFRRESCANSLFHNPLGILDAVAEAAGSGSGPAASATASRDNKGLRRS